MLAVFLAYFRSQSVAQRRLIIRERLEAYRDHPAVSLIRDSLPDDVREAFDRLIDATRRSNWGTANGR